MLFDRYSPTWTVAGFLFLLFFAGSLWGSFLGVVAYRLPKKESILVPHSRCENCGSKLPWQEIIPFKTWIFGGGKCVFCRFPIPLKTLLPEVITGLFFASLPFFANDWQEMAMDSLFFSFALPLSIIDAEYRRLPHALTILAAIAGFFSQWAKAHFSMDFRTLALPSSGYLTGFLPLALISFFHPRGLGMGDAFWLGAIGTFVGPIGVLETLLLSTVSASGGAILYWSSKKISGNAGPLRSVTIPFGPFLSIAGAVTLVLGTPLTEFLVTIM